MHMSVVMKLLAVRVMGEDKTQSSWIYSNHKVSGLK